MARRLLDAGYTAGMDLIKNRVVVLVNGMLYLYHPLNTNHDGMVIGFSKEDYLAGDPAIVIRDGYIDMPALSVGSIYYASSYGTITTIAPTGEPIVKVGLAKSTTELVIQFNDTYLSDLRDSTGSSIDMNLVIALAVAL
jgi:hypothetical protein